MRAKFLKKPHKIFKCDAYIKKISELKPSYWKDKSSQLNKDTEYEKRTILNTKGKPDTKYVYLRRCTTMCV